MPAASSASRNSRTQPLDLSAAGTIRGVARRFGVRFQRRLGQNFLADRTQLDRLCSALEVEHTDRVIEIGPGLGVLTRELARRAGRVIAIEIDPACVQACRFTLKGLDTVELLEGDVLRQPLATMMAYPYRVVGNIPYNLTGALLVKLLEQAPPPARIDLLVQREVAERLSAPPGGWSLATLGVRVYGQPTLLLTVPKEAFLPSPKVGSALVRIVPDPEPALARDQLPAFFAFARPFFQARRKQLAFVVSRGLGLANDAARRRLLELGIDPARRAETLTLDEWKRLFQAARPNWKPDMMQAP